MGSSMAMVAMGPMPGSTPMAVPSSTPIRQNPRFTGVTAAPKPVARWASRSISARPDRDRLAEQIHKQHDGEGAHGDGEGGQLEPAQPLRGYSGDHGDSDHRSGEPHPLDQQPEGDDGSQDEQLRPQCDAL